MPIYSGWLNAANPALQNRSAAFAPLTSQAVSNPAAGVSPRMPGYAGGQGSVAPGAPASTFVMPMQMASQLSTGAPGAPTPNPGASSGAFAPGGAGIYGQSGFSLSEPFSGAFGAQGQTHGSANSLRASTGGRAGSWTGGLRR